MFFSIVSVSPAIILPNRKVFSWLLFLYQQFPVQGPRTIHVELGRNLTLPCVPPESIPSAHVYWAVKRPYGGLDPYNYDKRVSMDHESKFFKR